MMMNRCGFGGGGVVVLVGGGCGGLEPVVVDWKVGGSVSADGKNVESVVSWACDFLEEWSVVHSGAKISSTESQREICHWRPPNVGVYKINTDAATNDLNRRIGYGIIIRNSAGFVKAAAAKIVKAMLSPLIEEALAVKNGILLALESEEVILQRTV
ncbi:hypothetical protein Ddye_016120 [Dipteronia dyeriana]|uniref:RNase H type-1 domain-containing protein n=1 Tax=Dipteronia dyeriana TaxID=168575 RepID=A0AAD9WZ93_9ROSI|nr:hypothetical protein Ddye_016120 [Dipteronia dyeriana]